MHHALGMEVKVAPPSTAAGFSYWLLILRAECLPVETASPGDLLSSCILFQGLAAAGWTHVFAKCSVVGRESWVVVFSVPSC